MARNDSSIPSTRWRTGQRIRPSAWSGADSLSAPTVLRTLNQCGDVAQDMFPPPWSLHLGISETLGKPDVHLLANGFELHFRGMADPVCVRCLMTSDGRWTGQANLELHPTLFSPEFELREQDDTLLIENDGQVSALAVRLDDNQTRFCLCVDAESAEAAVESAQAGLPTDLDVRWARELTLREPFYEGVSGLDLPTDVISTALETLVYHLQPTEKGGLCSATALPLLAQANVNTLFPLIQAWLPIDQDVATRLLENTLARIQDDGTLHAEASPLALEPGAPAWPMLIQTCVLCQEHIPDSDLVAQSIPRLEKYLLRSIQRFDPDQRGLPAWTSAAASFLPDTYDANVASASLATLLLREIDVFLTLSETHPVPEETTSSLESIRDRLLANLSTELWNEDVGACLDRYIDGVPIARVTLSGLMPLGIKRLPELLRTALLRKVSDARFLGGGPGLASWQAWESDEQSPPATSAHQLFVLLALEDTGSVLREFESQCAESVVKSFDAHGALPIELRTGAIEAADPAAPEWFESSLMAACLALRTVPDTRRHDVEEQAPAYLQALDRHRFTILFALIVFVVGVITTSILNDRRRPIEIKEKAGSTQFVQNLVGQGEYATARDRLDELKLTQDLPPEIAFIEGNLLFREKRFAEAIALYEQCVEEEIAVPKANINLALALYHEGRLAEAIAQYERVIEEFGEDRPGVQKLAEAAIRIIRTHGTTLLDGEKNAAPAEE